MRKTALVIAMVMVVGMSVSVMAATINITNGGDGSEYAAFKLLNATNNSAPVQATDDDGEPLYEEDGTTPVYESLGGDKFAYTLNSKYTSILQSITGKTTQADIVAYIAGLDTDGIRTFADAVYAAIDTAELAADYTTTNDTFASVDQGYYLIVETKAGTRDVTLDDGTTGTQTDAISLVMLDTAGLDTINIQTKEDVPSVDKQVQDEAADKDKNSTDTNGWGETADHEINESFQFKLTATIPADVKAASYKNAYKVVFTDTMSAGVTFESIASVKVNGTAITDYTYTGISKTGDEWNEKAGGSWTLTIADIRSLLDDDGAASIEVIYNAHLNANAAVTTASDTATTNKNSVKLDYSNNPYATGEGSTPEDEVWVYTFEIDNFKVDGNNKTEVAAADVPDAVKASGVTYPITVNGVVYTKDGDKYYTLAPLNGVGFTLYNSSNTAIKLIDNGDGTYTVADQTATTGVVTEMTSNNGGKFHIKGLDNASYTLKETSVPSGYNKVDDISITVTAEHEETAAGTPNVDLTITPSQANGIVNYSGTELPSTGGMGTTIFYIIGAILVVGAGVVLITRRRMQAEK